MQDKLGTETIKEEGVKLTPSKHQKETVKNMEKRYCLKREWKGGLWNCGRPIFRYRKPDKS